MPNRSVDVNKIQMDLRKRFAGISVTREAHCGPQAVGGG